MTEIEGREQAELAKIKAREQSTRDAIQQGDVEVPLVSQFTYGQLRLRDVVADEWGRLWRVDSARLVLIFKPERGS